MTTTLADLIELIADRTDIPLDSLYLTDVTAYINQAYDELYGLVIKTFSNFFIEKLQFTIATGEDGYTLPVSVRYLYGVDGSTGGGGSDNWYTVNQFMMPERNYFQQSVLGYNTVSQGPYGVAYRWIGRRIEFIPARLAPATYRIWYVPTLTKLVDDTDEVLFELEPYVEYIIRDASSKLLMKEEAVEQSMYWKDMTDAYRRYVEGQAADKDQGSVERTVDVTGQNGGGGFGWF